MIIQARKLTPNIVPQPQSPYNSNPSSNIIVVNEQQQPYSISAGYTQFRWKSFESERSPKSRRHCTFQQPSCQSCQRKLIILTNAFLMIFNFILNWVIHSFSIYALNISMNLYFSKLEFLQIMESCCVLCTFHFTVTRPTLLLLVIS